jgi:3-hydroxyisobutyrate dehydrogenase
MIPGTPACRNYEDGFAVSLIKKDMVLALEAAHSVKAETDMLEKSLQYYVDLEKAGLGRKALGYVYQYLMKNKAI